MATSNKQINGWLIQISIYLTLKDNHYPVQMRVVCRKKSHHLQKRPIFAGGVPEKVTSPAAGRTFGIGKGRFQLFLGHGPILHTKKPAAMRLAFLMEYDPGLDAGLAIFLTEFLEGEGSLANASACSLVLLLVDVLLDSSDLLLNLSDNSFHDVLV